MRLVRNNSKNKKGALLTTPTEQLMDENNMSDGEHSYVKPVYKVVVKKINEDIAEIYNGYQPTNFRPYSGFDKSEEREIKVTENGNYEGYVTKDEGK